jgi:metal-sulfur cluster biosynthetic enzyme
MTRADIDKALAGVVDPEFHVDIVTMGLVRDVRIDQDAQVHVLLTLTTPFCPFGEQIQDDIKEAVRGVGAAAVTTELTFSPPWQMPEGLRLMMGI